MTSSRDIIRLTMMPISTSQITERKNVINIIARSVHAPILLVKFRQGYKLVEYLDEKRTCSNTTSRAAIRRRGKPRIGRYCQERVSLSHLKTRHGSYMDARTHFGR